MYGSRKKNILLKIKRALSAGEDITPLQQELAAISRTTAQSPTRIDNDSVGMRAGVSTAPPLSSTKESIAKSPDKDSKTTPTAATKKGTGILSGKKIAALMDSANDIDKLIIQKLIDLTSKYRPDKDGLLLKAFEDSNISYALFRSLLHSQFGASMSDFEFNNLCYILDNRMSKTIDGYGFIILFIKLYGIRVDMFTQSKIKKQQKFLAQQAKQEMVKSLEREKKCNNAISFSYTLEIKETTIKKFNSACKAFDPAHPQSPKLDALMGVQSVKPGELREVLKATFKLALDKKELGVVVSIFFMDKKKREETEKGNLVTISAAVTSADAESKGADDVEKPAAKPEAAMIYISEEEFLMLSKSVDLGEFLKYMVREGLRLRDEARLANLKKQEEMTRLQEQDMIKRRKEVESRGSNTIDFDYSALDEARAEEKIRISATKYDKNAPGCQPLDGFMCDALPAGQFRELVKNVFDCKFSNKELGYVINKYQNPKDPGRVPTKPFLNFFLQLGLEERGKTHSKQLKKQKIANERAKREHDEKMKEINDKAKKALKIEFNTKETDLKHAMDKLLEASIKYDKVRGVPLTSFDQYDLNALEFKEALFRTFNLTFNKEGLGALLQHFDKNGVGKVNSHDFLLEFFQMGNEEKEKQRLTMIKKQRDMNLKVKEDHDKKLALQENKSDVRIEYEYTEVDEASAIEKMRVAAMKYDKSNASSLDTSGFDSKEMPATLFKEMIRRTFGLKLSPAETGALLFHLDGKFNGMIDCAKFLTMFLALGISERHKEHREMLDRQIYDNKRRVIEEKEKLDKMVNRPTSLTREYTEEDSKSASAKLLAASEGYDKYHAAAPSLVSFETKTMTPGQLRENLKRTFNVKVNKRELSYLVSVYGANGSEDINCADFLTSFLAMGKDMRDSKHKDMLQRQRGALELAKRKDEEKLRLQVEGAELFLDFTNLTDDDWFNAMEKITVAATKYDKSSFSAPSTAGFTGGSMKGNEFNGLIRRTFGLWLDNAELASVIKRFESSTEGMIDSKKFLIEFSKVGIAERAKDKAVKLEQIRLDAQEREKQKEKKKRLADAKGDLDIDKEYYPSDKKQALEKLTAGSALFDRYAPGSLPLDAFDVKFLKPMEFKELLKRIFKITLRPKELGAAIYEFSDGKGCVDSSKFLNTFLKMGQDERDKMKVAQLNRQRREDDYRKNKHERMMKEAAMKNNLQISYNYHSDEKDAIMQKLRIAAKKYDKNSSSCLSLDGFDQQFMDASTFREMLKRTFGIPDISPGQLGALMHYYDTKGSGTVNSKDFLVAFLQMGIGERDAEKRQQLEKNRMESKRRQKEEEDKLASQWARLELQPNAAVNSFDVLEANEKLLEAAVKFDSGTAGPAGLQAFQAKSMSAAIFREMLKRSFNLKLSLTELSVIMGKFDKNEQGEIICSDFVNKFLKLGIDKREQRRLRQIEKQRKMDYDAKHFHENMKKELDEKAMVTLVDDYTNKDFIDAMEKIRILASEYNRGHPSAPSLDGFTSASFMTPAEFKNLLTRVFGENLSVKELSALVTFFDSTGEKLVNSHDFIAYFYKVNRLEMGKRRKEELRTIQNIERRSEIENEMRERSERDETMERIRYTRKDEQSFMKIIRKIAQEYVVDSIHYNDELTRTFKGPALDAKAFKQSILRIFNVKMSYPEVGVIIGLLSNEGGGGTVDGQSFLSWFYRFARKEEGVMLGTADDDVSIVSLRTDIKNTMRLFNPGASVSSSVSVGSRDYGSMSSSLVSKDSRNTKGATTRSSVKKGTFFWEEALKGSSGSHSEGKKRRRSLGSVDSEYGPDTSFTAKTAEKNWVLPFAAAASSTTSGPIVGRAFQDDLSSIISNDYQEDFDEVRRAAINFNAAADAGHEVTADDYNPYSYAANPNPFGDDERSLSSFQSMSTMSHSIVRINQSSAEPLVMACSNRSGNGKKAKKAANKGVPTSLFTSQVSSDRRDTTRNQQSAEETKKELFDMPKAAPLPVGITAKLQSLSSYDWKGLDDLEKLTRKNRKPSKLKPLEHSGSTAESLDTLSTASLSLDSSVLFQGAGALGSGESVSGASINSRASKAKFRVAKGDSVNFLPSL